MANKQKSTKENKFKKTIIIFSIVLVSVLSWAGLTKAGLIPNFLDLEILCSRKYSENNNISDNNSANLMFGKDPKYVNTQIAGKPVIYFYPKIKTDIQVKLDYKGTIIADYPKYNNITKGWDITAFPDGNLINKYDNKEYSYLFWEGISEKPIGWDLSKGFVVKGEDTREFLQEKLKEIGLTPKEYNEFIVYWYPLMKNNKYNLITFADKQYTDTAPLTITPTPDSMLRVFMVFKALDKEIKIKKQEIKPFDRKGFSVVEWGGTEVK